MSRTKGQWSYMMKKYQPMVDQANEKKNIQYWCGVWNRNDAWTEEAFTSAQVNLEAFCKSVSKEWVFQLERGLKEKRLHYQIYLKVDEPCDLTQLMSMSSSTCPMIFWSPCSNKGKDALSNYCKKSETRVAGPWASDSV